MLGKLAVRNVRRQMSSYLIYFVTVAVTVALMFSIDNVLFSDVMLSRVDGSGALQIGLGFATALVAFIVAFVIGYASSFMLKLRKREFGTYMTLGLDRGDILKLFAVETLIIGLLSLGVGLLLGLGLFQAFMLLIRNLLEMDAGLSAYSWRAFVLTVGLVVGMFLLSSVSSALYLRRVKIYELLHAARYVQTKRPRPVLWGVVAALSLAVIVFCASIFMRLVDMMRSNNMLASYLMLGAIVGVIVAVFLFSVGLAKSVTGLRLKSRRYRSRGVNTFVLRQLSAKLNTNAVLFGVLAVLMSCAVIAANFSFTLKATEEEYVRNGYPFSASAYFERDQTPVVSTEAAETAFARYGGGIEERLQIPLYEAADYRLTEHSVYGDKYSFTDGERDVLLRLSDYNRLRALFGLSAFDTAGYILVDMHDRLKENVERFRNYSYTVFDSRLQPAAVLDKDFGMSGEVNAFLLCVVPDAVLEDKTPAGDFFAWQFTSEKYDGRALNDELSYDKEIFNGLVYSHSDYIVRRYVWEMSIANSAIWIVAAVYIAVVFVFVSMAVLALKSLSDVGDNRKRYDILYKLGLSERDRSLALFREICTFFVLPFILPLLLSIPTVAICAAIMKMMSFSINSVLVTGGVLAAIFIGIYLLYMLAAFAIGRNKVICGS